MKIRKGSLVHWLDHDPTNVGIVVSEPREVHWRVNPKIYAIKLAVDVMFNGRLHKDCLVEQLQIIKF